MRRNEPVITSCAQLATACLNALDKVGLFDGPFVVIGHSVGCWVAMDMLSQARKLSKPMPKRCFFSAMPSISVSEHLRPWTPQSQLDEEEFKEECRQWSISPAVFEPNVWPMYGSLLRSDFKLFDTYLLDDDSTLPFPCPIDAFYGSLDDRVTRSLMQDWSCWTTAGFTLEEIEGGNHMWPLNNKKAKCKWLGLIVEKIKLLF